MVTRDSLDYLKAHQKLATGCGLPNPGTWTEQPSKLNDAFDVIDAEQNEIRANEYKKLEKLK